MEETKQELIKEPEFLEADLLNGPLIRRSDNYSIYTTSLQIAFYFGKPHKNVLRSIRNIIDKDRSADKKITRSLFYLSCYKSDRGKIYELFKITRGGFILITQGMDSTLGTQYAIAFDTWEQKQRSDLIHRTKELQEKQEIIDTYQRQYIPGSKEFFAYALQEADKVLKEQERKLKEQEQLVKDAKDAIVFKESMKASKNGMPINDLAKMITQYLRKEGYEWASIGGNTFHKWLRDNGYLISQQGRSYNMPTQRSIDMNLFEINQVTISGNNAFFRKSTVTVNQKGQEYFIKCFKAMYDNGGYLGRQKKEKKVTKKDEDYEISYVVGENGQVIIQS